MIKVEKVAIDHVVGKLSDIHGRDISKIRDIKNNV